MLIYQNIYFLKRNPFWNLKVEPFSIHYNIYWLKQNSCKSLNWTESLNYQTCQTNMSDHEKCNSIATPAEEKFDPFSVTY